MRYHQVKALFVIGIVVGGSGIVAKRPLNLEGYRTKRDFTLTTEPSGRQKTDTHAQPLFVVQKHAASHLHYDIRLESDGVLVSWAVPKGIPLKPGEKHLAIQTEDHPLEYAHFEGTIPPGNYGAGTVKIWDTGTFKNITKNKSGQLIPVSVCLRRGRLKIECTGKKLHGVYVFIKTKMTGNRDKQAWLLFKMGDNTLKIGTHTIHLTHTDKIMFPTDKISKQALIDYYHAIAPHLLTYTKNRFITMFRAPAGIEGEKFYQKSMPESYPRWIKSVMVPLKGDGENRMMVANNTATLVYLTNQDCITPHISLSRIDKLDYPDRMIFDLDPSSKNSFDEIGETALKLKELLETYGLKPFVMTTGSRGLHILVPLIRRANFDTVRAYAQAVANQLVADNPKTLTTEIRKNKRRGRIYIDTSRNAYGQTSVAPYAIRALPGAPVATPLFWEELHDKKLTAQRYTISTVLQKIAKDGNPWELFARSARSPAKLNLLLAK